MMTKSEAALIKGMLARGDKQQWIVAWFGGELNPGRIAEISTGQKFADVQPAPERKLPPRGPYISARGAHKLIRALQKAKADIEQAIRLAVEEESQ